MNVKTITTGQYRHVTAAGVTLAGALLLPFLIHLLPPINGTPWGAVLLPIFIAPLVGVVLFESRAVIVAALFAPIVNHFVIGMPAQPIAFVLTIELTVFAVVLTLLHERKPDLWLGALIAYLLAKVVALLVMLVVPVLPMPALVYFTNSLTTAIPGMLVLVVVHYLLVRNTKQRS